MTPGAGLLRRTVRRPAEGRAQQVQPGVDVAVAVLDQPVGVEHQPGALRQLQFGGLEGQAAQAQRRGGGQFRKLHAPVGVTTAGRRVAGPGHGDPPGDRVVDRVQAGGAGDRRRARSPSPLVLASMRVDQLVQVAQQFVGRQVQGGEVVHGGAQPAHGGRRVQAVADHIADDQRHPGAGQRDDVEPVPAHPRPRGQVAVGDVQGVLVRQAPGQQAALQRHRHRVLAGVAAGVVDGHRRPRRQLLGEGQVLVVERRRRSPTARSSPSPAPHPGPAAVRSTRECTPWSRMRRARRRGPAARQAAESVAGPAPAPRRPAPAPPPRGCRDAR